MPFTKAKADEIENLSPMSPPDKSLKNGSNRKRKSLHIPEYELDLGTIIKPSWLTDLRPI